MRKAVSLLLYDDRKRFLLQFRDAHAPKNKNVWMFFGGGIEQGESPEQALHREALEELNHVVRKPKLFYTNEHGESVQYCFVEHCTEKQHLRLQEGQSWGWFTVDEIHNLNMPEDHKEMLQIIDEIVK